MNAFEIFLNGEKLCVASIGDKGVLAAIVTWVMGDAATNLFLEVGGLVNPTKEHVSWINQKRLSSGDEIQVKVVATDSVDEPKRKDPAKAAAELEARKNHVRRMAAELGWEVQERAGQTRG